MGDDTGMFGKGYKAASNGPAKGKLSMPSMLGNPGQVAKRGPTGGAKLPAMTGNRPAAHGPTGGAKLPPMTGNRPAKHGPTGGAKQPPKMLKK